MSQRDLVLVLAVVAGATAWLGMRPGEPADDSQRPMPSKRAESTPVLPSQRGLKTSTQALKSPKATPGPPSPVCTIKPETPLLTISGIHPGMALSEAEALLGKAKRQERGYSLGRPVVARIEVQGGKILSVTGGGVRRNGQIWLRDKMSSDEIQRRLGTPISNWSNNSWCGNCYVSEDAYPEGLTVTTGWGFRSFRLTSAQTKQ